MTPLLLSLLLAGAPASGVPDGGIVTAKGHRFLAEVARTPQEQARGLMCPPGPGPGPVHDLPLR